MRLLKYVALAAIMAPLLAVASASEIHTITRNGTKFRHFEVALSSENTLLPNALEIRRERLDENSKNFNYGQFEVFIPARDLDIGLGCKSNYIVRMPMTIEKEKTADIKAKQAVFFAIKKAVETKTGSVRVVLEITYDKGCNLFFRDGPGSRYIDYVGPIKQKR
ncbi:hypothetical protein GJ699_03445 [Duganella sp. FT80W]|uniref:Uncharacterized protein n=1 Tax=Duganella guangzhouensis TaxID=2666084 RepID=A0A6I2KTS2_9BURK|nr:hypothetical protein [Duganella guangzhouensis]MRW89031.1 hypothetical protein [Duganella guangzhouensis]